MQITVHYPIIAQFFNVLTTSMNWYIGHQHWLLTHYPRGHRPRWYYHIEQWRASLAWMLNHFPCHRTNGLCTITPPPASK